MANKKKKLAAIDLNDRARVELRFDSQLNERIRSIADGASISVNQLIQGVMRWAVHNAVIGEPYRDENGYVQFRDVPGCVFFGSPVSYWDPGEREHAEQHYGEKFPKAYRDKGKIIFALDFTERFVVRDDASGTGNLGHKRDKPNLDNGGS